MINPELEKLIIKGIAEYRVFNHAFGMFGTLPLPPGNVGIIVDIMWYPFLNTKNFNPNPIPTPSVGSVSLTYNGADPPPVFVSNVNLPPSNTISVNWDVSNPAVTQATIQGGLDAVYGPGVWTCTFTVFAPGSVEWVFTTNAPGTIYNGFTPTIDNPLPGGYLQGNVTFVGGGPGSGATYGDLFNFNEYQLKIDGKKSKNYYHFRNEMDFQWFDGLINNALLFGATSVKLTDLINNTTIKENFLLKNQRPTQINTYLVCEEYIKLTISRNAQVYDLVNTMGFVNNRADEQNNPNGIQNSTVLLNSKMGDTLGNKQDYQPPQKVNTGVTPPIPNNRLKENYTQDYTPDSELTEPNGLNFTNPNLLNLSPYVTHPLVTLGVVLINKPAFDKLQNS